jgi:hypothetical protein
MNGSGSCRRGRLLAFWRRRASDLRLLARRCCNFRLLAVEIDLGLFEISPCVYDLCQPRTLQMLQRCLTFVDEDETKVISSGELLIYFAECRGKVKTT